MDEPARDWIVVLFTGSECEEHSGKPCLMNALGPFTHAESEAVIAAYLDDAPWTAPHRLLLDRRFPVLLAEPAESAERFAAEAETTRRRMTSP